MKHTVILICLAIGCILYSCKKDAPPAGNTGTNNTGTTTDTTATTTTLSITDFNPKTAKPGSNITITGTGFGSDPSVVKLLIGTYPFYDLVSVSPTKIVFTTSTITPSGKISVFINGKEVTSSADFTALPQDLKIVGFVGSAGQGGSTQLGHELYIYAQGFGTDTNKIFISFGGTKPVKANYIGPEKAALGTVVPRYAQPGKVTLTVGDSVTTSDKDLNFDMSISDYSPKSFHVGDTIKITGFSFTSIADMSIDFNNDKGTRPISLTPTEMHVIVPPMAKSGYLHVSANLGTITDFTWDKFTVLP